MGRGRQVIQVPSIKTQIRFGDQTAEQQGLSASASRILGLSF